MWLLAALAAAPGCRAESAGSGGKPAWCSITDGTCGQWLEAALNPGESALLKKIEARARAVYLEVFSGNGGPAGQEAARFLREHPEISFKTGLYGTGTAGNWCLAGEKAVYTDLRYLKERRTLAELAGDGAGFRRFVEGNAPFMAHELVHMRAHYELRGLRNGAAAPAAGWSGRYRDAEEYLGYLVEQSYVGFETLKDAEFVPLKGAMGTKWRWAYYAEDPEKYCAAVLNTSCRHAGLEDLTERSFPEIDEYYKGKIARQKKIRAAILSRLKKRAGAAGD